FVYNVEQRTYLEVNEGFTRLTGWTREEAVGKDRSDLNLWLSDDDRRRFNDLVQSSDAGSAFVCQFRRKDQSVFWGSTSFRQVGDGRAHSVLATTRDITAQVEAEQAVAASRAELLALINSTDDLIWVVDPESFKLVVWNNAFAATIRGVIGLEVHEGLDLATRMPPDEAETWRGYFRRALTDGPFTIEFTEPQQDRVVLLSFNTLEHGGRTTGVTVFGKDITDRKHEQERRTQMELQLYEAQKMESLGSLAGGVAHDFNNMLGGIMGYADLLLAEEADPHKREDLEAILQAATRSSELTRKLLAFGRRGKNIVEPLDLNTIVRDGLAMLRPTFARNITLETDFASESTIDGDPSQINQLVVNLCINANEAMPEGGTLTLRTADVTLDADAATAARLAPGTYVSLTVADTGVGIPEAVKARIFEPFFTTKTRGHAPGTGLGLSTVYGIVHLHHGSIAVDSTEGQGTSFTVLLPQGDLAPQAKPAPRAATAGNGLILVVEDEPLLRSFATSALGSLGYAVLTAADGEEGVAMFRSHHTELSGVLLDLKMPKKDGRETFMECRAIDASVPVLICSGYGDNEEAQGLISLGAKGLLAKPYRVAVLGEMLSQAAAPPRG
ncbi:MAG: ATP-binding protein, partial [Vicinamibacterales bacterium]